MSKFDDWVREEADALRRTRDELAVQANLAAAELKDRWEILEKRWYELEGRVKVVADETHQDIEEARAAAELLVKELREGYAHMKSHL